MLLSCPQTTTRFRPPKRFKMVKGKPIVRLVEEPQFAKTHGKVKGAKRKGLIYEERVINYLEDNKGEQWESIAGPWFEFADNSGHRYAQADWMGINLQQGRICIAEVKLSRVPEAWWQLNRLYKPLVEKLFPSWEISLLEIAATVYSVAVPEEVKVVRKFEEAEVNKTSFMQVDYA